MKIMKEYPRDLHADVHLLSQHGVRWVFAPDVQEMFPPGDSTRVEVSGPAKPYEGTLRPSHFLGRRDHRLATAPKCTRPQHLFRR